jgi:hypothetical protein
MEGAGTQKKPRGMAESIKPIYLPYCLKYQQKQTERVTRQPTGNILIEVRE